MPTATKKKPTKKKASAEITVTIARLSQDATEIKLKKGASLRDALLAAGYGEGELKKLANEVRVNGREAGLNEKLPQGAFVTVAPRVQGGR